MRRWTLPMLMALATWAATNPAAAQGLQPQAHCLAQHQGATVPGRLTDRGCTIAWDGGEVSVANFTPYSPSGRWGRFDEGPYQQVGNEPRGPTGVCRGLVEGQVLPGKLHGGECLVGFRGREMAAPTFEVLLAGGATGGAAPPPPPAAGARPQACGREGERCSFAGSRIVAYGAGDRWVGRVVNGGIECSHQRFGDPAFGQRKECVLSAQQVPGGTADGIPVGGNWRTCASEDGECRFQGRQTVRYGADGRFIYRVAEGSQRCDFRSFGHDPAFGTPKQCAIQEGAPLAQVMGAVPGAAPAPGGARPGSFAACGTESQGRCTWSPPGLRMVRYGEGNGWFLRLANGDTLDCSFRLHGDPIVGRHKACDAAVPPVREVQPLVLVSRWRHCADEAGTCQVPQGPRLVRYGSADRWVARLVEGQAACGVATFGRDPYFGRRKICEVEEPLSRAETERALAGELRGLQRQSASDGGGGLIVLGAPR